MTKSSVYMRPFQGSESVCAKKKAPGAEFGCRIMSECGVFSLFFYF
jgi:hypothetical protein